MHDALPIYTIDYYIEGGGVKAPPAPPVPTPLSGLPLLYVCLSVCHHLISTIAGSCYILSSDAPIIGSAIGIGPITA